MLNGIIDCAQDARWLKHAGRMPHEFVDVFVDALTEVALWYSYEHARCPIMLDYDTRIDSDGYLVIFLDDDANPPGWYHYQRRAESDDAARQLVREKFGDVVTVPLAAMLSERKVSRR